LLSLLDVELGQQSLPVALSLVEKVDPIVLGRERHDDWVWETCHGDLLSFVIWHDLRHTLILRRDRGSHHT
jgi:hypothetical protein